MKKYEFYKVNLRKTDNREELFGIIEQFYYSVINLSSETRIDLNFYSVAYSGKCPKFDSTKQELSWIFDEHFKWNERNDFICDGTEILVFEDKYYFNSGWTFKDISDKINKKYNYKYSEKDMPNFSIKKYLDLEEFDYNSFIGDLFTLEDFINNVDNNGFISYDGGVSKVLLDGKTIKNMEFIFELYYLCKRFAVNTSKGIVFLSIDKLNKLGKIEIIWVNR